MFQSTPLCEGRRSLHRAARAKPPFQSTPLCEGRRSLVGKALTQSAFQSTPLCEGRLDVLHAVAVDDRFQSTPLCEGRHAQYITVRYGNDVSIHAPLRGATSAMYCKASWG